MEITDTGWYVFENSPQEMNWIDGTEKLYCPMPYPGNIFGDGTTAEQIVTSVTDTIN